MYGRTYKGVERSTFLIGEPGHRRARVACGQGRRTRCRGARGGAPCRLGRPPQPPAGLLDAARPADHLRCGQGWHGQDDGVGGAVSAGREARQGGARRRGRCQGRPGRGARLQRLELQGRAGATGCERAGPSCRGVLPGVPAHLLQGAPLGAHDPAAKVFDFIATAVPGPRDMLVSARSPSRSAAATTPTAGVGPHRRRLQRQRPRPRPVQAARSMLELVRGGLIRSQIEWIDAVLSDARRTAAVLTALPEEMPVVETLELIRDIAKQRTVRVACACSTACRPSRCPAGAPRPRRAHHGRRGRARPCPASPTSAPTSSSPSASTECQAQARPARRGRRAGVRGAAGPRAPGSPPAGPWRTRSMPDGGRGERGRRGARRDRRRAPWSSRSRTSR